MRTNENDIDKIAARYSPFDKKALQEIISHFDRDYLSSCSADEVAQHLNLSQSLKPNQPVHLLLSQEGPADYKIVIIAFDYFSEFSILCGLISSFGLNIESGSVQTIAMGEGRKKIIDLFRVRFIGRGTFDLKQQKRFKDELLKLTSLLEKDDFRGARTLVNHRLISNMGHIQKRRKATQDVFNELLQPVQIRFDNSHSKRWTILSIRGHDSPAFLYAFSNALTMRNIYIHRIRIESREKTIHNKFYISNRRGKKLTNNTEKNALKISALLIQQFTHYLSDAPDPMMAITHFDQFLDKMLETGDTKSLLGFLKKKDTMSLLARFFGTSGFLWEDFLRIRFDHFFPILEHLQRKPLRIGKKAMTQELQGRLRAATDLEAAKRLLNNYKDEEMFRIDIRHLNEPHCMLSDFSNALTDLAEAVIQSAYKICNEHLIEHYGIPMKEDQPEVPSKFSICAFGKFGGRELGYASDIELLFIYESNGKTSGTQAIKNTYYFEKLSKQIIDLIQARQEGIFSIDTRLRPHGLSGTLAVSVDQFKRYYFPGGKAAPFERQALIKLRAVAGSRSFGKRCENLQNQAVYNDEPWNREDALMLRQRQVLELVPKGRVNVKYSEGGLIDIEYLTQYLQIIHGKDQPLLQTPNTLEALAALAKLRILPKNTASELREGYIFIRELIDALRIVRGNAKDLLLPDEQSEEFIFLSRRMGFKSRDWEKGKYKLKEVLGGHMARAHQHYQSLFSKS